MHIYIYISIYQMVATANVLLMGSHKGMRTAKGIQTNFPCITLIFFWSCAKRNTYRWKKWISESLCIFYHIYTHIYYNMQKIEGVLSCVCNFLHPITSNSSVWFVVYLQVLNRSLYYVMHME